MVGGVCQRNQYFPFLRMQSELLQRWGLGRDWRLSMRVHLDVHKDIYFFYIYLELTLQTWIFLFHAIVRPHITRCLLGYIQQQHQWDEKQISFFFLSKQTHLSIFRCQSDFFAESSLLSLWDDCSVRRNWNFNEYVQKECQLCNLPMTWNPSREWWVQRRLALIKEPLTIVMNKLWSQF